MPRVAERRLPLAALLLVHALVWTVAAWLARGNLDVPGDMVENYVWGIEWQAGYAKHPPLFAWVTAAWFSVFPRVDLAYFALSALNAALALAGVAMLARRFLPRDEAALATLALAVTPLYTALAIKFNANAVLLPAWAWAAYGYAAAMQTGRLRYALLCGVCTALAVLGKYYSVVLVLGFVIATLAVPAWRARLRGPAPWVAIAAGALVLLPHALWQVQNGFATFGYAAERSGGTLGAAALRFVKYAVAQLLYLLPALLLLVLLAARGARVQVMRASGAALLRRGLDGEGRALWWLALSPLLAAGAIALAGRTEMASVWGMAQSFGLTVLLVAATRAHGVSFEPARAVRVLCIYWVVVMLGSAAAGWNDARRGGELASEPRAELAAAAREAWRQRSGTPLRIVGGGSAESGSVAFYGDDAVHWWHAARPEATPWISPERLARDGALLVCRDGDADCRGLAARVGASGLQRIDLHKRAWGRELPPVRYELYFRMPTRPVTPAAGRSTPG
jgi:4-amino-4-deoxy-L-arabinose transferase-like glycosyltransferase